MVDRLGAGLAWLDRQRERFMTRAVTYLRGAQAVTVRATIGRTVFRLDTAYGGAERIASRDYLIRAAHLAAFGEPQRGDRVIETAGGLRHIHEILAPGQEPAWTWTDPDRRTYRIHAKHLTSEPIP